MHEPQPRATRAAGACAEAHLQGPACLVRCAIYTRKSTEEGLSQPFNSLDAQREAAEAYVLSQRALGWTVVSDPYDDGGFSGGNLERPALQRLLSDIDEGRIDCVVVYKVDRLSRSLLDFTRIMERFEQRSVSFVSLTQQFNTTTSLGRLTMNILLSFAQFEREIIGERTRDKLAASRRKGKWVGGRPPLGYDVTAAGGALVINEGEAAQVREMFALYRHHGALDLVVEELNRRGWSTKRWTSRPGQLHPGQPFSKQGLLRALRNVTYTGQVNYKGAIYPGEHPAVVEREMWEEVNRQLGDATFPAIKGQESGARTPKPAAATGHVPRVTRLLALALKCEDLVRRGAIRDYAELARTGRVSRARVSQIMNLLHLAAPIQEQILELPAITAGRDPINERALRRLSRAIGWPEQIELWNKLSPPAA